MSAARVDTKQSRPAVETHLLGQVPFDDCLALQEHLVEEVGRRSDGQIRLLLCEHPAIITVGRAGSPGQVHMDSSLVRGGQISVRWVKRGGGCLVHAPGQLAVYPIVPLAWHGFSVGEYLHRLQSGIAGALEDLGVAAHAEAGRQGLWGRTGQLVAIGVAVRNWVAHHGAFINVCPPMGLMRLVRGESEESAGMSCLQAERRGVAKMAAVRTALVGRLADALGCWRYHLYTGHPMLRRVADSHDDVR